MNRYVGIMNSLALLLIPFYIWACPYLGISWWFCSVFCLFLFIAVMHGYFTHKRLRTNDLMSEDLLVVARKLMEIKSVIPFGVNLVFHLLLYFCVGSLLNCNWQEIAIL